MTQGIYPSEIAAAGLVDALLGMVTAGGVTDLRRIAVSALIPQIAGLIGATAFGGATYSSVALGLANTSSTDFFAVPAGGVGGGVSIYKNAAGSALEVATLPGTAQIAAIEGQIAVLEAALTGHASAIGEIWTALGGQSGRIDSLDSGLTAATEAIGGLTTSVGEQSGRIDSVDSGLTAATEAIGGLTTAIGEQSGRIDSLDGGLTAATAAIGGLTTAVGALDMRVDALEGGSP